MDLESLKCFEVMTKLGDRIPYHRERSMPTCNSKSAGTYTPMDAPDVGERQIATVVDVEIDVQVIWPRAQRDTSSCQQINFGFADHAYGNTNQAQPREHGTPRSRMRRC